MAFGLCRGAWPYKGPCTAGGKLAAGALRVLKMSIQHAGARKTRLGHRPLIPVAPGRPATGVASAAKPALVQVHLSNFG